MAKSEKGISFPMILLTIGIVVQIVMIAVVLLFIKDSKEAQRFQEAQAAKESAEWAVPLEMLAESEQSAFQHYLANAEQTIRSYWHSADREFRLTVKSPALRELMARRVLLMREGQVGNHLVLTLYYNPLRVQQPEAEDLAPIYRLIRYEKPELVKLYEDQQKREEKSSKKEKNKTQNEENKGENSEVSSETPQPSSKEEKKPLIKEEDLHFPFESDQIIKETDDYILYVETMYGEDPTLLNKDFLIPYLTEDSFRGDYGWETSLFYWETEPEEESTEEAGDEKESSTT